MAEEKNMIILPDDEESLAALEKRLFDEIIYYQNELDRIEEAYKPYDNIDFSMTEEHIEREDAVTNSLYQAMKRQRACTDKLFEVRRKKYNDEHTD